MTDTVTLYRADDGWRWRYEASGRCLADSGQGYSRRIDAVKGACRVVNISARGAINVAVELRRYRQANLARNGCWVEFVIEATR